MFSKWFGRKKQDDSQLSSENKYWSFLGADMHSHFIPGIDDGAKTIEDSLSLLRSMSKMGYKTIVTTPHVMMDFYPNSAETIMGGLQEMRKAIKENNIEITLYAAAEYYIDEYFMQSLESEPLLSIFEKEVLVEFSMIHEPPMLMEAIFRMQSMGYQPIIAHPERYAAFHNHFDKYRMLKERNCLFQMNMLSLSGYYGKSVKMVAEDLLRKGMYDYCGSDMHHERHANALLAMTKTREYQVIASYPFHNAKLCSRSV